MNENIYKLEIKIEEIMEKMVDKKVLVIINKTTSEKYKKVISKMFRKSSIIDIADKDEIDKELENLKDYALVMSTPFYDKDTLITRKINIKNNTKHIILIDNNVTQSDILLLNKDGNALFLGNNLDVYENMEMLGNYISIVQKQQKQQSVIGHHMEKTKDVERNTFMVMTNVIVVQNIMKKALESVNIKSNRYLIVPDTKTLINKLSKDENKIKVIILASERPPFEEIKMISKASKEIKIMYVTSTKDPTLLEELENLGVDDFIFKPFEFENLLEKLKNADGNMAKNAKVMALFSLKEMIEKYNKFVTSYNLSEKEKTSFKDYFKYLQI